MHLCIFEDQEVEHLLPLVHTRAACDLRIGMRTIRQAICDSFSNLELIMHVRPYLAGVTMRTGALVNRIPEGIDVLFVNGRYIPEPGPLLDQIRKATESPAPVCFVQEDTVIAAWAPGARVNLIDAPYLGPETFADYRQEPVEGARMISRLWELIEGLMPSLKQDFRALTGGYNLFERGLANVSPSALLIHGERVFVGSGAVVRPGAVLNAEEGPIYIDEEGVIGECAVVRGPAYVGPHTRINPHASIENTAIGPGCKVGGEVHHSIFYGNSNKAHAGYVGHSYIGQWCNMGADSDTSNLRNDYAPVTLYDMVAREMVPTGQQFLGLFMADHSKCGINTMFNTGTVVGTFCNLYGSGFMPKYVPSFSWGDTRNMVQYRLDKAFEVAAAVMARRETEFTDEDREMLQYVFEATRRERA